MMYLPLRRLHEISTENNDDTLVIAVSGGRVKRDAVYAALKAKLFNVLVTDSNTAEHIIDKND
jgi:DNA-binding transcriptional regulator LsrR (DeoR family)